ncbi:MAG: ATP-binding cassette domain-containing protein [Alphaproteobacteria bacterium]|nr:ATP-binding cassette domain-containing protein [Alphaproteobacteria bacterium]
MSPAYKDFNHAPILPVSLDKVDLKIGNKRLLKEISCRFQSGERYVFIGPNGAGKSLLLKICHGLLKPSNGQILWQSKDSKSIRRQQAMVLQRTIMLRRSARANIEFALSANGVAKSKRADIIDQVVEKTGLQRSINKPAHVLSLGEQQRLSIARAWAARPEIMFLDEPTASLDPPATHAIETLIQEISDEGTTIVMTSHDLGQARRIATQVGFMFRGHLKELAPTETFFETPKNDLARAFLDGKLIWWQRRSCEENVDSESNYIMETKIK